MRRIACDTYKSIDDTKYELNSLNYGWWQKQAYNYVDADNVVFGNEKPGVNRARLASALLTGALMTGDDYSTTGAWTSMAQSLLQNQDLLAIAKNGWAFQPVEGNTGDQPNNLFIRGFDNHVYLAVFNYDSISRNFNISLGRLGSLSTTKTYAVKELFGGVAGSVTGTLNCTVGATDCKIFRFDLGPPVSAHQAQTGLDGNPGKLSCRVNLFADVLEIYLSKGISSVTVVTTRGQIVRKSTGVNAVHYKMNVSKLGSGTYFLLARAPDGSVKQLKLTRSK